MTKLIEILLAFILKAWEKRPMQRKNRVRKGEIDPAAPLTPLLLIALVFFCGLYVKERLGWKSGTEVAMSELRDATDRLSTEVKALTEANTELSRTLAAVNTKAATLETSYVGLQGRVAVLETSRKMYNTEHP